MKVFLFKLKIFVAHQCKTKQSKTFFAAFRIKFFIAEGEHSSGRSIEGQVNWNQVKVDFTILLAIKGKTVNNETGARYKGLDIADELGGI